MPGGFAGAFGVPEPLADRGQSGRRRQRPDVHRLRLRERPLRRRGAVEPEQRLAPEEEREEALPDRQRRVGGGAVEAGERPFGVAVPQDQVREPESEVGGRRVRLGGQRPLVGVARLVEEPLVVEHPAEEGRQVPARQPRLRVGAELLGEEPGDPHRVLEPPVLHVEAQQPEVGVPRPLLPVLPGDAGEHPPGEAFVFLRRGLRRARQVEVEERGGEQFPIPRRAASAPSVEERFGGAAESAQRDVAPFPDRAHEVTASVPGEPPFVRGRRRLDAGFLRTEPGRRAAENEARQTGSGGGAAPPGGRRPPSGPGTSHAAFLAAIVSPGAAKGPESGCYDPPPPPFGMGSAARCSPCRFLPCLFLPPSGVPRVRRSSCSRLPPSRFRRPAERRPKRIRRR